LSTATKFYPKLANLFDITNLPPQLNFAETPLEDVLNHIYFKDLQFEKSPKGSWGFYSIRYTITINSAEIKTSYKTVKQ